MDGTSTQFVIPGVGLAREVPVHLWSPPGSTPNEPLPLLIANDGPEYRDRSGLVALCAARMATYDLPRHRIALLSPGEPDVWSERDVWYAGLPAYAEAVVNRVLPAIYQRVATVGKPVAIGASLGALSALSWEHRYPGTFGGLFLQSGSFFRPEFDLKESWFPKFWHIVRLVADMQASTGDTPLDISMTCGQWEENLRNNQQMAAALARQGHRVQLEEVPGHHNFEDWGKTFDPHLTDLLQACWPPAQYGQLAS